MRALLKNAPLLGAGILLGAMLAAGQGVFAQKKSSGPLPLEELRTFTEIFAKIKNDYVEPIDDKTLLSSAIHGMLSGLDPHSAYLEPEDYKQLRQGTTGEFGGLGIEVGMEDGFVKVISPIDNTPASRAGVEAGDLVIRLDDTPVKGMTLAQAVKVMRGKPGTDITLTVVRKNVDQPLKIVITRDVIKVRSVRSRILEDDFGYVRISQFQSHTGESLREAISKLKDDRTLKGMILDLRNNPGGVLSAAVSVSDAFLKEGIIVYTDGRLDNSKLKFNAKPTDLINGAPLVVLINGGSASASEIVAGALQDHKRAVIMGEKSFGKGSVQTILPMENGSALKLTTARYFTPSGRSIQAKGIEPDIKVARLNLEKSKAPVGRRLKEKDLLKRLKTTEELKKDDDSDKDDKGSTDKDMNKDKDVDAAAKAADKDSLARKDYMLYEALNLLKGLSIINSIRS